VGSEMCIRDSLGTLLVCGCGRSGGAPTATCQGTVTYKGQPLKDVVVTFNPDKGRSASGTTDAAGHFVLSCFARGDGAVPGNHKVTITDAGSGEPEPMPGTPEAANYKPKPLGFPKKYTSVNTTNLTAVVEEGKKNEFSFELTD